MEPNVLVKLNALDNTKAAFASLKKNLDGINKQMSPLKKDLQAFEPAFKKLALIGTAAFAGILGVAGKSIQAYAEVERAQRQLEHAVIDVSHGTSNQVIQINRLTAALEKKAGVDADSLNMGVAQLSTFGLSTDAVIGLTKSLADLTVNQSGVNASSDDYIQSANNIAKALNGQFGILEKSGIRFSEAQKNLILFGTETQKVAAIQEGFAQNLRETTDTVTGIDLATAKMRRTFENINENLGKALTPAFLELSKTLQPIIERFADWSEKNPELVARLVKLGAVLAGLTIVVGGLGIAIGILMSPITLFVGALALAAAQIYIVAQRWQSLPLALKAMLLPLKLVVEGVRFLCQTLSWAAGIAVDFFNNITGNINASTTKTVNYVGNLQDMVNGLIDPMAGQSRVVQQLSGSIAGMGDKAKDTADKIKDLKKEAADIFTDAKKDEASSNQKLADAIIEQEEKVHGIKKEIRAAEHDLKKADTQEQKQDAKAKLSELRDSLEEEQQAMRDAASMKMSLRAEIDEAERRANLSEFERKVEDIQRERVARLEAQVIRLQEIQTEIAQEKAKSSAIAGAFNSAQATMQSAISKTREIAETESERMKKAFDKAISSMNQLSGGKAVGGSLYSSISRTIAGKASGGSVSANTPYIVGEAGQELFVPNTAGRIIPNGQPAMAGGNTNITINIGQMIGDKQYALKMGDMIIREIKQNLRI